MAAHGGEYGDVVVDANYLYAISDIEKHGMMSERTRAMVENEKRYGRAGGLDPAILENYRVVHVALRLLDYLGIREQEPNCQAWGLWPQVSHDLVHGMRRSSAGPASHERMRLFRHVTSACNLVARDSHLHFFMQGSEAQEGMQLLSRMGAWRKLAR